MYNSQTELGLLPPELYSQVIEAAAEELDQDLYIAAYGEPESVQENSVHNLNEILDAMGID